MNLKEQFDTAQALKYLRQEKANRLERIASEQQLTDECDAKIAILLYALSEEDIAVINSLVD